MFLVTIIYLDVVLTKLKNNNWKMMPADTEGTTGGAAY